jgi:hypothetical protein
MASLHGYEIATDLPLEGACATPGVRGELRLDGAEAVALLASPAELTAVRLDAEGEPAFALARVAEGPIVWDRQRGAFGLEPALARIAAAPAGPAGGWSHLVASVAVPLLLAERDELGLHASAVLGPRGAVLFCGPSGRGKSSAALLASAAGATAVLADDAMVITDLGDGPVTWPGGGRLWVDDRAVAGAEGAADADARPAGRAARQSLSVDGVGPGPFPIAVIAILGERGQEPLVRRVDPADALPRLVPCLVHAGNREALRAAFTRLATTLERVPAWAVSLPDRVTEAREAMTEILRAEP